VHRPDGSTFWREMTWLPSRTVRDGSHVISRQKVLQIERKTSQSKTGLRQSMRIYFNNLAIFHPYLIRNHGALGFFGDVVPTRTRTTR